MKNQERIKELEKEIKRLERLNKNLVKKYKDLLSSKNIDIRNLKKRVELSGRNPEEKLTIAELMDQYPVSRKTIDRMRKSKGLYPPIESNKKGTVHIVRKDFEALFYDR
ncbi:hypothetical protein [Moheibacter sediminis]|uniref:hypothetical protein n=1 Tax=Moheibacter sediminis TaxID=1434700 RepID=UPI000A06356A|nr:hypothetical protein [Moheibacter sediminis]